MDDVATRRQRVPGKVNPFSLYHQLWIAAGTKHREEFENGCECPFTREEVEGALRNQGICNEDMQAAIDHCIKENLLEQKEGAFHAVQMGN